VDYQNQDDITLMEQVARANADALAALFDRYSRLVFSVALHIVGERSSAEEITLDVFNRVWQKAATFRSDLGQVRSWLTGITRHQAIDVLRKQNVRPVSHTESWERALLTTPPARPPEEDPEHIAALTMRREVVRAAVAQLPPEQQEVLALAYFRGYSHREIAAALNQPLGTVKTRLRLAAQKLRRLLDAENHGQP
jgi:RNA polymerase sigma-70 factor (ECF subfamily)